MDYVYVVFVLYWQGSGTSRCFEQTDNNDTLDISLIQKIVCCAKRKDTETSLVTSSWVSLLLRRRLCRSSWQTLCPCNIRTRLTSERDQGQVVKDTEMSLFTQCSCNVVFVYVLAFVLDWFSRKSSGTSRRLVKVLHSLTLTYKYMPAFWDPINAMTRGDESL